MDLKEFLRPTWQKAILFAILYLLPLPLMYFFFDGYGIRGCSKYGCAYAPFPEILTIPLLLPLSAIANLYHLSLDSKIIVPSAAITLVLFYALSCLLIFLFSKRSARPKRKK